MAIKASLPPGFRFHPTDSELVLYYLKRKIMQKPLHFEAVSEIDLYKYAPWDLPEKSCLRTKDRVWYFFSPRDRKYTNGQRANRATSFGFWKTTGNDRPIVHDDRKVGMKKTLIFHKGKAPKGERTDWVMYEYRLDDAHLAAAGFQLDAYVVVKIFHKSGPGPKAGDQYGAPFNEEEWEEEDYNDITIAAFNNPKTNHHNNNINDNNINNNSKNDNVINNINSNNSKTLNLFDSDPLVEPSPSSQQAGTGIGTGTEPMDVVVLLNELICDSVVPMEENYENDPGDGGGALEGIFEELEDLETGAKPEGKNCGNNNEERDLSSNNMELEIGNEQFVELNDFLLASGFSFYGPPNNAFAPAYSPHYSPCFR
ncbi:hypothetical protein LUZ60_015943 [Juncus effusus]|nr:hypothetical protein LUZ60_015943 [Juncus effusus]